MAKFKWLLPLVAVLFTAAGVFAINHKSEPVKKESKVLVTKYFRFNGSNTPADYQNPAKWEVSDAPYLSCGTSGTVCTVSSQSLQTTDDIAEYVETNNPNTEHGTDYDIQSLKS